MDGYFFRGLNNFNWELFERALERRIGFLEYIGES